MVPTDRDVYARAQNLPKPGCVDVPPADLASDMSACKNLPMGPRRVEWDDERGGHLEHQERGWWRSVGHNDGQADFGQGRDQNVKVAGAPDG
jgi:hypothetical protein